MDLELIERFFVSYLEQHGLDYRIKDGIYTVSLDKHHRKLYGQNTLKVSLDGRKGTHHLGLGTFMFDSMVMRYAEATAYARLEFIPQQDPICEVNELLDDMKTMRRYVTLMPVTTTYLLFDIRISTARQAHTLMLPLLKADDFITTAHDLERAQFAPANGKVSIPTHDTLKTHLNQYLADDIVSLEKEHDAEIVRLLSMQQTHTEEQYQELSSKENAIQVKIDKARDASIRASTFQFQDSHAHKAKSLQKKYNNLVKKNRDARNRIKHDFEHQTEQIRARQLEVKADLVAFAEIDMPICKVETPDALRYYIPALKTFVTPKNI